MEKTPEITPISVEKYFMRKPKPWKKNDWAVSNDDIIEKRNNINHLSRLLRVTKSPAVFSRSHREQSKRKRYKKEPPFLLRNCIKAREEWSRYEAKMKQWASEQYEKKKRERKAARDALKAHNQSSTESNCSSRGEHSSFEKSLFGAQEGGLLRSFYTIWNINRLKAQTATCEEAREAIEKLSQSPSVERCLTRTPNGGIKEEIIEDPSSLSWRAKRTLRILASVNRDDDDLPEHSDSEDGVEIWNRRIEALRANSALMLSATNVTNTTADNDQLMRSAHDDAEEKNGQLSASSPPPESITEKCSKTGVESAEFDKAVTPGSGDQVTRRLRSADRSSSKLSEKTESPNKTNTPKEGRTPRRRSTKIRIETSPNENFHRIDAKESSDESKKVIIEDVTTSDKKETEASDCKNISSSCSMGANELSMVKAVFEAEGGRTKFDEMLGLVDAIIDEPDEQEEPSSARRDSSARRRTLLRSKNSSPISRTQSPNMKSNDVEMENSTDSGKFSNEGKTLKDSPSENRNEIGSSEKKLTRSARKHRLSKSPSSANETSGTPKIGSASKKKSRLSNSALVERLQEACNIHPLRHSPRLNTIH